MPHKDREKRLQYLREYRDARRKASKCLFCGDKITPADGRSCAACKEKARQINVQLRDEAFAHYGEACACCGLRGRPFLTIDHIEPAHYHSRGKRGEKVPKSNNLLRVLRAQGWPDGYQTLCWNCNYGRAIYGVCPHQRKKPDA